MSPQERRAQLVGIGLDQLISRPSEPMSVDEVARRAGISRGLLFRYFATKQEFFAAVAEAMTDWIDRQLVVDDHGRPEIRLRDLVDRYLTVLGSYPDWAAVISHADFGTGPEIGDVILQARRRLVDRTGDLLGLVDEQARLRLAGWWALVHTVGRQRPPSGSQEDLIEYLLAVRLAVLDPPAVS